MGTGGVSAHKHVNKNVCLVQVDTRDTREILWTSVFSTHMIEVQINKVQGGDVPVNVGNTVTCVFPQCRDMMGH